LFLADCSSGVDAPVLHGGHSCKKQDLTLRALAIAASIAGITITLTAQSAAPARPRLTGISHVAFRVSDETAARKFYGELLGLPEGARAAKGHPIFRVGGHQYLQLEPGLPESEEERLSHLAFATPDVKALAAHLTARGVQVSQPAERCADTAIRVIDPDGHPIEFVQMEWPPKPTAGASPVALSTRLLHAGLIIKDEEAAHRFYRDILGFSDIWRGGRTEGVISWVNMRVPDGTDYLEYMLQSSAPDRRQRGTLHHVCLRVDDIQTAWEAVGARSAAMGRPLSGQPNVGRNGRWQLNLYDPDGTRVELMEPFTIR
jgi:catechol 2,3-dioxygenase-like lactoylglutathione lyase family enzyme